MIAKAIPRHDLADVFLSLDEAGVTPAYAVFWARSYGADYARALAECAQPCDIFWLAFALAVRGYLTHKVLVTTACACARSVLHLVPVGEGGPRLAVEAAERWVRDEATANEVIAIRRARTDHSLGVRVDHAASAAWDAAACVLDANAALKYVIWSARWTALASSDAAVLDILRRELCPALLDGLTAYSATIRGATR